MVLGVGVGVGWRLVGVPVFMLLLVFLGAGVGCWRDLLMFACYPIAFVQRVSFRVVICVLLFLLLLLAISLAPVRAEYRTFTNTEGRTVDAELIKADATQAWLRLKGGRVVPIARDTLSEADQTFITTWIADKVPDLKVKPDFDRGLTKGRSANSSVKQSFGMRVEIKNFSSKKALEVSEVIYYLVGRDATDADRYKVLSRQVFELTIEPGQTKKAFFENIVNHYSESERRKNGEKSGRGQRGR